MKVLFLQNVLFDYRVPFYNSLAQRGYQITVLHSGQKTNLACEFEECIVPVKSIGPLYFQQNRPKLNQYQVVIAMFDLHWPANAWLALFARSFRLIFWGHGLGKNTLTNRVRIALANKADATVLYTQQGCQAMLDLGLKKSLAYIANNTVEVSNHQQKPGQGNSFLFVGRLQTRKRIDLVMQAFAKLLEKVPDQALQLVIVGTGDIQQQLVDLAKKLNIQEQTKFLGEISDNTILKPIFHQAIAYVSPGHLGLGLNHALAFGVPIISNSQVKHAPEVAVLNPNNSLMIDGQQDQECVSQLCEKMLMLVADPLLAKRMSEQSYADYVGHCSMERMVDGFVQAIEGRKQL
ncbi:glycosyltransferase family 4 protein [Paraglaciecola aestuariivivens]